MPFSRVGDTLNLGRDSDFPPGARGDERDTREGVGHRGQEGSDPHFPPNALHLATITQVGKGGRLHARCTCLLEWSFPPLTSIGGE